MAKKIAKFRQYQKRGKFQTLSIDEGFKTPEKPKRPSFNRRQSSIENLKKARAAKRAKMLRRKAAAAKRTKVGQSLKKFGIPTDVGTVKKVTINPPINPGKVPRGGFRATDEVKMVRSPRLRPMGKGITDPLAQPPEYMPQSVQDYFLTSRAIHYMGYDEPNKTLKIIFTTGYGYYFFNIPIDLWHNFKMAPSKGRFFMEQIYGYWTGPRGNMVYHPYYQYSRFQ